MVFQDALTLVVRQLELPRPFIDPIQEELGRLLADPRLAADLDVERAGRGEPKGLGMVGHGADQHPAALAELDRRQLAARLGPLVQPHLDDATSPFFTISR